MFVQKRKRKIPAYFIGRVKRPHKRTVVQRSFAVNLHRKKRVALVVQRENGRSGQVGSQVLGVKSRQPTQVMPPAHQSWRMPSRERDCQGAESPARGQNGCATYFIGQSSKGAEIFGWAQKDDNIQDANSYSQSLRCHEAGKAMTEVTYKLVWKEKNAVGCPPNFKDKIGEDAVVKNI